MSNPAAIGPGMAVAVIATRYRVPAANRFLLRFAEKLSYISRHDLPAKELVVRGVFAPKVRTERRKAS
jgi:flagellar motor component MotA